MSFVVLLIQVGVQMLGYAIAYAPPPVHAMPFVSSSQLYQNTGTDSVAFKIVNKTDTC